MSKIPPDLVVIEDVRFRDEQEASPGFEPMAIHVRPGDMADLRELLGKGRMVLAAHAEARIVERVERDGFADITGLCHRKTSDLPTSSD
jgi:hypothetical protein